MNFLAIIMGSPWGWKYILAIVVVGLCVSRSGALTCWALIVGAFGWLINLESPMVYSAADALSAGPIEALQFYLSHPPWNLSPGGAAMMLGLVVGAGMLPAADAHVRFAIQLNLVSAFTEETKGGWADYLSVLSQVCGGPLEIVRGVARAILVSGVGLTMAAGFWLALSAAGEQGAGLNCAWLGLADITQPRFIPVWNQNYFIAPLLLSMIQTVHAWGIEESGGYIIPLTWGTAVARRLVTFIALAFFLPAGISLFLVGYSIAILPSSWIREGEVVQEIIWQAE